MTRFVLMVALLLPILSGAHTLETSPTQQTHSAKETLCEFAPENNLKIPVNAFNANNEMTEEIFNDILDNIYNVYQPKFAAQGANFEIQRAWEDSTVNAFAQRSGSTWYVKMFGGLARHPDMTPDGFAMVACHEIGHHLAGAPKYRSWASNEGQSDYFATLKCARFIWARSNNFAVEANAIQAGGVAPIARTKCRQAHPSNRHLQAICVRASMAGMALSKVLASLSRDSVTPSFSTPDRTQVSSTYHGHPRAQCRLDTYVAGAVCDMDKNSELSDTDPAVGTCSREYGASTGVRPLCWFSPEERLDQDIDMVVASAPVH